MKKGNAGLVVLIMVLLITIIVMVVYIAYNKLSEKDNKDVANNYQNNVEYNNVIKNERVELTTNELKKIEEFINEPENNPFAVKNYSNPADFFGDESTLYCLSYAVQLSKYAKTFTEEDWEKYGSEPGPIAHYGTSVEDIIKLLKDKLNYAYTEKEIRENLMIHEKLDKYVTFRTDSIWCPFEEISGYKYDGKIYVETDSDFTITLTEQDGNYYFYASEGLKLDI